MSAICNNCPGYAGCCLNPDGNACKRYRKELGYRPTNGDRIRAMSDEELANALEKLCREDICDIVCHGECHAFNTLNKSSEEICKDFIAMWLYKPAKEE